MYICIYMFFTGFTFLLFFHPFFVVLPPLIFSPYFSSSGNSQILLRRSLGVYSPISYTKSYHFPKELILFQRMHILF